MQYSLTHLLNNYQVLTFPQALMTSLRSAAYGLVRERNVNFFFYFFLPNRAIPKNFCLFIISLLIYPLKYESKMDWNLFFPYIYFSYSSLEF